MWRGNYYEKNYEWDGPRRKKDKVDLSPSLVMRGMTNSLHALHAVHLGVRMGLFKTLAECPPPVSIRDYVRKTTFPGAYIIPWLRALQSAGVVEIDGNDMVRFNSGWQEALTDEGSVNFIANLAECHLEIARTYRSFPRLFREGVGFPPSSFSERMIRGISRDSIRFANVFARDIVAKVPRLRDALNEGASVYDVGCGGGVMTLILSRYFPSSRFIGIDILPRAIEVAREESRRRRAGGNVEFKVMSATELPKRAADCVILNEVLHEMEPKGRLDALKGIRRALKPEGILFLADVLVPDNPVDYAQRRHLPAALCDFFEAPWGSQVPTQSALMRLLSQAGFGKPEFVQFSDEVFIGFVKLRRS